MATLFSICEGFKKTEVKPSDGRKFTLEEAQSMVGGYVEVVYLKNKKIALVDEDGRLKNKPKNTVATLRAMRYGYVGFPFVGDVVICDNNEF